MDSLSDFLWLTVALFVDLAVLLVVARLLIDLFRDIDASGAAKAAWTAGLVLLPVLGIVAYLAVRGDGMSDRQAAAVRRSQQQLAP